MRLPLRYDPALAAERNALARCQWGLVPMIHGGNPVRGRHMAYGERGRPAVVDLADRRALERYRPADAAVVEEARRLKEAALLDFGLTESAVASWLFAKCHHQLATTAIDTAARPVTGLRELARDVDAWEERLRRAAERSGEGGDDSDAVHQILANAELSQLKKHRTVVTRLVALLPAKLRAMYLVGASEKQQRFWTEVFTGMRHG